MLCKYRNFIRNVSFLNSQKELHKNTVYFSSIMGSFTNNFKECGKISTLSLASPPVIGFTSCSQINCNLIRLSKVFLSLCALTLSQTTNFRLFQIERVCR